MSKGDEDEREAGGAEDLELLVGLLLLVMENGSRKRLAALSGVDRKALHNYERRDQKARRKTRERLAAAVGVPLGDAEAVIPALRRLRAMATGQTSHGASAPDSIALATAEAVRTQLAAESPGLFAPAARPSPRSGPPDPAFDRRTAEDLWDRLERRSPSERLALVEEARDFQTWALVERLCAESGRATASDPRRALELAELALRTAENVPEGVVPPLRVQGYALAFLANAHRAAGDLASARVAFDRGRPRWGAGAAGDPGWLDGSRVLDLEASVLRAQGEPAAALDRLEQAIAICPSQDALGRILLKKCKTLENLGLYVEALATLSQAEPLIDPEREPRNLCVLQFNRVVNLCHLGRHAEAEGALPGLRRLVGQLDNAMDQIRLSWLEGRIAAGLGRNPEAIERFSGVRDEMAAREIRYDEALVSLEVAELHLREGHTAEVKALARQMEPVFRDQGVHEEARKALDLFRRAVERETVTAELARRLVVYLYRAQGNPKLRFERG
jgi:tetratricopeptide (TPR) repeat protein